MFGFFCNEVYCFKLVKLNYEMGEWFDDFENFGFYEVKIWWCLMEDFVVWMKSLLFVEVYCNRVFKEMFCGFVKLIVHEVFLSTDLGDDG